MENRKAITRAAEEIKDKIDKVYEEIKKVFIGSKNIIDLLFTSLLSNGHILLEGVPGTAKTTLVKAFASTIGCKFKRIQFTPDLLPSDITGTYIFNIKENNFILHKGPIFANIILGDEINRAPAKTQSALLEAMQEFQVTIEGNTFLLNSPFFVLATQNPIEQEGVYLLPEAQLDRFTMRIHIGYPEADDEKLILLTYNKPVEKINQLLEAEDILRMKKYMEYVYCDDIILEYIVNISRFTRKHPYVQLGASPRASLVTLICAKAKAIISGRDYVIPDDIKELLPYILNHRIIIKPEYSLGGFSSFNVIKEAIEKIECRKVNMQGR